MGRALPKSDSTSRITRTRLGICALIAVALTASACGTSSPATSKAAKPSGSWAYPNADLANTRQAPGSVITSANVSTICSRPGRSGGSPSKPRRAALRLAGRVPSRRERARVHPGSGRERVRGRSRNRQAPVGVPRQHPDERTGSEWRRRRRREGSTATPRRGLCAERGDRQAIWVDRDLLNPDQGRSASSRRPQTGGSTSPAARRGARGWPADGTRRRDRQAAVEIQQRRRPDAGGAAIGAGSGGAWETPLVSGDGSVTFGIGNPYLSSRRRSRIRRRSSTATAT